MDKILVDTDVILDCLFDREPYSEKSTMIINLCETGKVCGFVTPVILSNCYYLLRRKSSHKKVTEILLRLLQILDVLIMDKNIALNALNSDFHDFEDALQYYSAKEQGKINHIITRNVKDFKKSDLAVFTPEGYLDMKL
ncbi:MAG: PIN domain-containing protein [Cyclobacteriaceae bacterium]|nr:PIN domain-containing protein [Cyclobacteriaceae bacterium]